MEETEGVVGDGLDGICLRIPSHIHKQLNRILHRLQVADIENPHTLDTEIVGQRQLFEHLLRLSDIEPLRITRRTYIIHVVVDAPTTLPTAFGSGRHTTDVTPVIVADKDHHIVGNTETGIVIVLDFLVQSPYLRGLIGGFTRHFLDDFALIVDNTLHQFCVGRLTHGLVTITTHTDGHNVVGSFHALNTLTEETVKVFLVGLIVPGTPLATIAGIFLMVTGHRLVVGGTHDDSHLVGQLRVLRIIGIESPTPHGWPKEVTFQTENQFEDLLVETMIAIVGAEGVLHPGRQTRGLIIQENTTIAHTWLTIGILTFLNI